MCNEFHHIAHLGQKLLVLLHWFTFFEFDWSCKCLLLPAADPVLGDDGHAGENEGEAAQGQGEKHLEKYDISNTLGINEHLYEIPLVWIDHHRDSWWMEPKSRHSFGQFATDLIQHTQVRLPTCRATAAHPLPLLLLSALICCGDYIKWRLPSSALIFAAWVTPIMISVTLIS